MVQKLTSSNFLSLHDEQEEMDRIVLYFDKGAAKHFGRIEGGRIVSKWGKWHVWKHNLYEVPLSYGSEVKYSDGKIDEVVLRKIIGFYAKLEYW